MTTVFFTKSGRDLAETFKSTTTAKRWAQLVTINGYQVTGLLEH